MNCEEIKSFLEKPQCDYGFISEMLDPSLDSVKDPNLSLKIINAIIDYEISDGCENEMQSATLGICEIYVAYRNGSNIAVGSIACRKSGILVQTWADDKTIFFTCRDLIKYLDGNDDFSTFLDNSSKKNQ